MPITWTFPQLFLILGLGFAVLSLGFSRTHPLVPESFAAIFGGIYLVANTACWNYFMTTAVLEGGEEIFRFGVRPVLPSASFYFGIVAALAVFGASLSVLRKANEYSCRQKWAFCSSSIVFLVGIVVTLQTPIAVQRWLDAI